MEGGLVLSYPPCSIAVLLRPHSYPLSLHFQLSQKPNFSSQLCFSRHRWDSNAETFRGPRSKFNFRGKGGEEDDDENEDEDEDAASPETDPVSVLLEDIDDSFWIFKVKEFHCKLCHCGLELQFSLAYACFRFMEDEMSSIACEELVWLLLVLFFFYLFFRHYCGELGTLDKEKNN